MAPSIGCKSSWADLPRFRLASTVEHLPRADTAAQAVRRDLYERKNLTWGERLEPKTTERGLSIRRSRQHRNRSRLEPQRALENRPTPAPASISNHDRSYRLVPFKYHTAMNQEGRLLARVSASSDTLGDIVVSSTAGAGGICVVEQWLPFGDSAPLHIHHNEDRSLLMATQAGEPTHRGEKEPNRSEGPEHEPHRRIAPH